MPPKTIITWVNGIGFNMDHMVDGERDLSVMFGNRPIIFCHNPTAMADEADVKGYMGDLIQGGTQKLGRITREVDALVQHLKEAIKSVGPKGKVIHIAHSQGALITFLASKRLTKEELSQIEVIAFGGAEVLRYSKSCPFSRCINYYSVNDPLLFVNPSAAKALRSGFMGVGGGVTSESSQLAEMVNPNAEPELVFLTPKAGDPIEDHGLFGPTYMDALKWEGLRYQNLYMTPWDPLVQNMLLHSKSLKVTAARVLIVFFEILKQRVILPVILAVLSVNSWIKEKVLTPIIVFCFMIWKKLVELIRAIRGEDMYEPITATNNEG